MQTLMVVGLGPGHPDYMLPAAKQHIAEADLVIGGRRHLESVELKNQETFAIEGRLKELPDYIRTHIGTQKIVVVVSGDTGFYSLLRYLRKQLQDLKIEAVPGVSSMQYLFSKLGLAWDDAFLGSLHGRALDLDSLCQRYSKVGVLTDRENTPGSIAETMLKKGINNRKMVIGERLSYSDEQIHVKALNEVGEQTYDELNVVLLIDEEVLL